MREILLLTPLNKEYKRSKHFEDEFEFQMNVLSTILLWFNLWLGFFLFIFCFFFSNDGRCQNFTQHITVIEWPFRSFHIITEWDWTFDTNRCETIEKSLDTQKLMGFFHYPFHQWPYFRINFSNVTTIQIGNLINNGK